MLKDLNIRGFNPNSLNEWPGHISCIVFFGGCNWTCAYCHNHEISKDMARNPEELLFQIKKMKYLDGVVLTGGEATLQPKLGEFAARVKDLGLKVKLSTNGTRPEVVEKMVLGGLVDCLCMDYKTLPELLPGLGASPEDIVSVRESFALAKGFSIDREYRTTLCPEFISQDILRDMATQLDCGGLWVLQQYEVDVPRLNPTKAGSRRFTGEELDGLLAVAQKYHNRVIMRKGTP